MSALDVETVEIARPVRLPAIVRPPVGRIHLYPARYPGVVADVKSLLPHARPVLLRDPDGWHWTYSRAHCEALAVKAITRWGRVTVESTYPAGALCTRECWGATPGTWGECVCRCNGFNHGSQHELTPEYLPPVEATVQVTLTRKHLEGDRLAFALHEEMSR